MRSRRGEVLPNHKKLRLSRQCELLGIHRSGLYYKPVGESELNLKLMRMIDEHHLKHPWLGVPRMTSWLRKDKGLQVNHKRVERLYRLLDIRAIGPNPNTSRPGKGKAHTVYPYLLRNIQVNRPNQVWATDLTYIPVRGGYLYLMAIIDLHSRFIVGWSLSNTMEADWCVRTLCEAVERHGAPQILNTDQGSQFTSEAFTGCVTKELGSRLSMDGKGRAIDNVFIERFWRSLKYEHVYLYPADDGIACYRGLSEYFEYYNHERRHSSIGEIPPAEMYFRSQKNAA